MGIGAAGQLRPGGHEGHRRLIGNVPVIDFYPAIDVCDGRVVRLAQGDYQAATVYGDDPVAAW